MKDQIIAQLGAVSILVDVVVGLLIGGFVEAVPIGGQGKLAVWLRRLAAMLVCGGIAAWASWMGATEEVMPQWWAHGLITGGLAAIGHKLLPGLGRAANKALKRWFGRFGEGS